MKEWPEAPFIRYLTVGNKEILVCNSLAASREVLQTKCYSFKKPDIWRKISASILGKGLSTLEHDEVGAETPGSK
jgi:hypothetical protein